MHARKNLDMIVSLSDNPLISMRSKWIFICAVLAQLIGTALTANLSIPIFIGYKKFRKITQRLYVGMNSVRSEKIIEYFFEKLLTFVNYCDTI